MPPAHPPEFRRRAIELARERAKPIAQRSPRTSGSPSPAFALAAPGRRRRGAPRGPRHRGTGELVRLRRENRVLRMEKEILGNAALGSTGRSPGTTSSTRPERSSWRKAGASSRPSSGSDSTACSGCWIAPGSDTSGRRTDSSPDSPVPSARASNIASASGGGAHLRHQMTGAGAPRRARPAGRACRLPLSPGHTC